MTSRIGPLGRHGRLAANRHRDSRGQILVLFAGAMLAFISLMAVVIDVSWYWSNQLRVQRAADAAALAGAGYLPGQVTSAVNAALAEATKNGYTSGGLTTVSANQNAAIPTQMDVTVSAPVQTYFMRVLGFDSIQATRSAKARIQLAIPMGSPDNFYGVFCLTVPSNRNCPVNTAIAGAAGTTVYSRGAFGAIQATGTDHGQGDAFIPLNDVTRSLGTNSSGGTNPDFDGKGYDYAIELPAGGSIYVFDPTACAVGDQLGSGDHWNDNNPKYSVSTYYTLYDATTYPTNYALQPLVASSGDLFKQEYQYDQSGTYGTPGYAGSIGTTSADGIVRLDCREGITPNQADHRYWHDTWWPIGTGVPTGSGPGETPGVATGLAAGTYRLNIRSAPLGAPNQAATFENDWSIEAVGTGANVYGLGRMATYNIIQGSGKNTFYLAQIGPENAGKTLEIDLFDPGDVGGDASLRILSPDGDAYNYTPFSYTTDTIFSYTAVSHDTNCGKTRGSSDTCPAWNAPVSRTLPDPRVKTASGGSSSFNDTWIRVFVALPPTYGCSISSPCLKPTGESEQGWWKIEYTTSSAANDTTTWMVNVIGNPIHLVVQ